MLDDITSRQYSEASLGEDFALTNEELGGDIAISSGGDFALLKGELNLKYAVIRRLTTPKGALARYVQDTTGLVLVNKEYGNGAYKYQSEPTTSALIANIRDEIKTCLLQETRIELNDIVPSLISNGTSVQLHYQITYLVIGSSTMESLSLIRTENTIEVV